MSNLITITEFHNQIIKENSIEAWTEFAKKQNEVIQSLQQQNKALTTKNHQLETMLMSKFDPASVLTSEEALCINQIDRLEKLSNERQLTLDEVKRFDLLVKNLKLIRDESTIVINRESDNLTEAELVALIRSESETTQENQ